MCSSIFLDVYMDSKVSKKKLTTFTDFLDKCAPASAMLLCCYAALCAVCAQDPWLWQAALSAVLWTCQSAVTWDFFNRFSTASHVFKATHTPVHTHSWAPALERLWNWRWQPKASVIRNDEEMTEQHWHKNADKMHLKSHQSLGMTGMQT